MLWTKINNISKVRFAALALFVVFFYLTRVPRLENDIINPDGVNWHFRSEQFVVALKQRIWENTYQHYHPGVSLMWITGVPVEILKQVTGVKVYNQFTFEAFDFIAKYFLINVQLWLSLVLIFLLTRIVHFNYAYLVVFLLNAEPFFLGNSRLYHLDVLLTLLLACGVASLWKMYKTEKMLFTLLAAFFFSMAFLTKSAAIGGLLFALGFFVFLIIKTKSKKFIKHLGIFLLGYVAVTFIFFPALWVKPVETMVSIFDEAERVGGRKGHGQIVLGEYTRDAGLGFYPIVLLMKLSPFTVLGFALYVLFCKYYAVGREDKYFTVFSGVFFLGYFVGMSLLSKKLDRYMLVMFPFIIYIAVLGYGRLLNYVHTKNFRPIFFSAFVSSFGLVMLGLPVFMYFPWYFTYTSPVFGNASNANRIVAQKPFGVGVHDLKNFIIQKYGSYPRLGFIDIKPMKAIYPNRRIFDIREQKPYDDSLVVLGINETFEGKSEGYADAFVLDAVFRINGLDYWRIYKKK
jgi:hypothetical protein